MAWLPNRWNVQSDSRWFQAELGAAWSRLFGVSHDDVDIVLNTFPIIRRTADRARGKCRTERGILEVYDALAEAIRSGKLFRTRLGPPTADLRVAHPPSKSRFPGF